ncbi:hypothetical protein H8356DRAFT_1421098 [Neocallimastix lanati (nom. inval.)]|nr:hypothetical protein H8356DRAFT_1421098 [Neocallimastix sp. JGI-2020a]
MMKNNNDKNKVLSIEEVLKIKDKYYLINSYIEIPDKNGNITRYNCNTCSYEEIINNKICKYDYEGLLNKCFNENYVFNDKNPIVSCDSYYKRASFIFIRDSCATNNECSSKECDGNICRIRTGGPSDSEIHSPYRAQTFSTATNSQFLHHISTDHEFGPRSPSSIFFHLVVFSSRFGLLFTFKLVVL